MRSRRKSTDMVKRRAKSQVEAELEEKVLSPEEQRRQMLLNIGVWFLVLAFCMTSGIMCFSIGGQEKMMQAQEQAQAKDPTQAEIDRWAHEVEQQPNDPVALANLGFYWGQKAQELENEPAPKADDKEKKAGDDDASKPKVTKEVARQNAHNYLDRSLQADPNYAFALQKYAELYIAEKDNGKAREYLERVIASCDQPIPEGDDKAALEANALNQKGQAVVTIAGLDAEEKNYGEAERRLNDLIREQPGNLQAYISKASVLVANPSGDKNEALNCFGEALKIATSLGKSNEALHCWIGRSAIYKEMGDVEKARKELQDCKEFFAGNPMIAASVDAMLKQLDGNKDGDKKADNTKESNSSSDDKNSDRHIPSFMNFHKNKATDKPAPAGEQSAPAGEQPAPAGEQPAPAGEQPAPAGEQPAPAGARIVVNDK